MSELRRRAVEGLRPGDTFTLTRTLDEATTRAFGALSRDFNPVHYDRRFAATKGFPGLIAHGLLVGSLLTEFGGQVGWLATGMQFRFLRPVFLGDTVTCRVTLDEVDERGKAKAHAVVTRQDGVAVVEASLTGYLPIGASREVLASMMAEGDPSNRV
jgi:acyl dehydratase